MIHGLQMELKDTTAQHGEVQMDEWKARHHVLQCLTELQMLVWGLEEHPELEEKVGAPGLKTAVDTAAKALSTWAQEAGIMFGPGPTDKKKKES